MAPPEEIHHRKIVVERFGGPEALRWVESVVGPPLEGQARVKVHAVGVGSTDLAARAGEYIFQRRTPFTPGYELSGEVVDFRAPGRTPAPAWLAEGRRVAACLPHMAAYTEYITLPIEQLAPLPDGIDWTSGAAIPLNYLTALSVLERHGRLKPGDSVLIHGAGGGVGEAICQLGRAMGLRMYGTASAEAFELLATYGISLTDYRRGDYESAVRAAEPNGVQAVMDHLGGPNLRKGYGLLAPHGVLVSYAFMGRPGHILLDTIRSAALNRLLAVLPGKRTTISSVPREIVKDPAWYRRSLERLFDTALAGTIRPRIGAVMPLAEAAAAHALVGQRKVVGKVVLEA